MRGDCRRSFCHLPLPEPRALIPINIPREDVRSWEFLPRLPLPQFIPSLVPIPIFVPTLALAPFPHIYGDLESFIVPPAMYPQ
jgi:hypothetical protein